MKPTHSQFLLKLDESSIFATVCRLEWNLHRLNIELDKQYGELAYLFIERL